MRVCVFESASRRHDSPSVGAGSLLLRSEGPGQLFILYFDYVVCFMNVSQERKTASLGITLEQVIFPVTKADVGMTKVEMI